MSCNYSNFSGNSAGTQFHTSFQVEMSQPAKPSLPVPKNIRQKTTIFNVILFVAVVLSALLWFPLIGDSGGIFIYFLPILIAFAFVVGGVLVSMPVYSEALSSRTDLTVAVFVPRNSLNC